MKNTAHCPNNDPTFDKGFSRWTDITADTYPAWRRRTYYRICIPVRLTIAVIVYLLRNKPWLPYVVGVAGLGGVLNLGFQILTREFGENAERNPPKYWWSKKFQFVIALLLLTASVAIIYRKFRLPEGILSYIIVASIVGGVVQSAVYGSC